MEDTRPTFEDICYDYEKEITQLRADLTEAEGAVDVLMGGIKKAEASLDVAVKMLEYFKKNLNAAEVAKVEKMLNKALKQIEEG